MNETDYELRLDEFKGPLGTLLGLIEGKKLEITRLNLAEVTADFLEYVRSLEKVSPRVLADFVSVAAKLVLIKSHAILPQLELSEEEEGEILDLEQRLKIYQEFRFAEKYIKEKWQKEIAFAREYLASLPQGFYLKEKVSPGDLGVIIEKLCRELEEFMPKMESAEIKLVSLEEKIEELIGRVDKTLKTSFNDITQGKKQQEIIVLFLALLHLLKDNIIEIYQEDLFSDIQIKKHGRKTR
jgi:segregation and condensation protein A